MEIEWFFRYVPEGQMTPDHLNRWAVDGYIWVEAKEAFPQEEEWFSHVTKDGYYPLKVCTICMKGTIIGSVPSVHDTFCASIPSFRYRGHGFGDSNFFGKTLDEVKAQVKEQFEITQRILRHAR